MAVIRLVLDTIHGLVEPGRTWSFMHLAKLALLNSLPKVKVWLTSVIRRHLNHAFDLLGNGLSIDLIEPLAPMPPAI